MRTLLAKEKRIESELGYIGLGKYPDYSNESSFDKTFVLDFLRSEYSSEKIDQFSKKGYLPFPFVTENLSFDDFQEIKSDIFELLKTRFTAYNSEYGNQELFIEQLKKFEANLKLIEKQIPELINESKVFLLSIDYFDPGSKKIHELFNEMGFIYDYYFFLLFLNSNNELQTLELSMD